MTERDFEENIERYAKYNYFKEKLNNINGDLGKAKFKINKISTRFGDIILKDYSDEARDGLSEYLRTMMLAEIERTKREMDEL